MSISKKTLSIFAYNSWFVETGTNMGRCVQLAIDVGFQNITSIENNEFYFNKAFERFKEQDNICLVYGDSKEKLDEVLRHMDEPATIYLDAHKSKESEQVWIELEAIKKHYIKGTVILIDDIQQLFPNGDNERLRSKLLEIDQSFKIYRIDGISENHHSVKRNDILVAEVKNEN